MTTDSIMHVSVKLNGVLLWTKYGEEYLNKDFEVGGSRQEITSNIQDNIKVGIRATGVYV
jgi:hypothetical protein